MAFKLNGKLLPVDVAFKTSDGTQYPANWLRFTTKAEKEAIGITEVADDPVFDSRFYTLNGTAKALDDVNATDKDGNLLKKPDGSIYMQLSSTPFDATKDGETRTAITSNGYASIMRKIN